MASPGPRHQTRENGSKATRNFANKIWNAAVSPTCTLPAYRNHGSADRPFPSMDTKQAEQHHPDCDDELEAYRLIEDSCSLPILLARVLRLVP